LLIAGHALDVEMQQIAGRGMFVAHDGRSGMQMTPTVELSAAENAADGGWADADGLSNLIGGTQLAAERDHLSDLLRRGSTRTAERPRGTIT
jgi:hypothetical protein